MNLLKIEGKVCRQDSVLQNLDGQAIIIWGQLLKYIVSLRKKIDSIIEFRATDYLLVIRGLEVHYQQGMGMEVIF